MVTLEQQLRPTEGLMGKDLGDEYLFYDSRTDKVHVLNETARQLYLLCDGTRSVGEVVREFAATYRIDERTAQEDACAAIEQLLELGVLRRTRPPA
ncbi:MAG TPA: PqqD family protein [Candidatus Polarisedimenticolaceae bacterium]|nr:PqqD family protein [Candidatus Polarisedimenticolaceae bacterium]